MRSNDYLLKRRIAIVSTLDQLYAMAEKRRLDDELPYAGAVLPVEAFQLIQLDPQTRLVDVRTRAELDWIGRPVVGDGQYAHIEWTFYPGTVPNQEFLQQLSRVATSDTPVLFLCAARCGRSWPPPPRRKPGSPGHSICWKALRATRTVRDIGRRSRAGVFGVCRGSARE
jgi:hypothetical protein